MNDHTCHAIRCTKTTPPRMFMCLSHWRMVPRAMQDAVWANYKRGQEIRKDPTDEYLDVTKKARLYVAEREGIELTDIERRILGTHSTPKGDQE